MKYILLGLKQRNPNALDSLMDSYSGKVYYLLKRIVGRIATDEDIEEMVSDVFVAVWNKIDKFDEHRGSLETFIFIQTRSIALTFKRNVEREHKKIEPIKNGEIDTIADHISMHHILEQNQLVEKINEFINDLKEPDKSFFMMRYYLYYEVKSIGKTFDVSTKAVESSIYRTRKALKSFLKKEGYYG